MALTQSQEIVEFKFREFKKHHFPRLSDGLAFMQFTTSLALREFPLTEADIQAGVTEGKDDGGIDGFHIVVNKTESISETTRGLTTATPPPGIPKNVPFDVVVVQSKSDTGGWDALAIPKLHEALDLILSGASRARLTAFPLSAKVVSQVESFRRYRKKLISLDPVRSFTVYVMQPVAASRISDPDKRAAESLASMIRSHLGSTEVRVELLSADGIESLRTAPKDVEGVLKYSVQPLVETHGKSEAWLGLTTVKEFLEFVRRSGTQVLRDEFFTTNVRDYAGSSALVNSAIRNSLRTDSAAAFWWMNNGVTVIVDKAAYQSDNAYLLSNPQIVNGLQTSNVIHEAASEGLITKKRLKESLLVRVISELDPAVRESIIQGTNNQAPVNSVQLYANDEFQMKIETFLETKGWFYERRRWQFRSQKVSRSRIRSILELSQAVIACVLLQPDTARARPRDLISKESGYRKVFNDINPLGLFSLLLDLMEAVESYLQSAAAKAISDDPTNDRYFLAVGVALRMAGVRKVADYTPATILSHVSVPDDSLLEEVHVLLYGLVGAQPDKKENDKLFKGTTLRDELIARVIEWNRTIPPKRVT